MKWLSIHLRDIALTMTSAVFLLLSNLTVYAQTPEPVVAIHVSELTQALETLPAVSPTPTGTGTTGYQWWYTSWPYFVAHESLKEALHSDGTPFVEISDSDIAAGRLLNSDGTPRYPILISLATEAVADNAITPLRDFVNAGGFLLIGSSAFTRKPDGTTRGNFALASEMGLQMASTTLQNQYLNMHVTKKINHRLNSHIPDGTLVWSAPMQSDQPSWTIFPSYNFLSSHYAWKVVAGTASILADGDAGPLLAVNGYGKGQFIYHGVFQPLIAHGGYDPGMHGYLIYRKAIEWAFESLNVPLVKLSPWPYQYDAALTVRHDFENDQASIRAIEQSAQYEKTLGLKGDYFFSTGALRADMGGDPAVVASLRTAVSQYGATIGSHNGGLKNPANDLLQQTDYEYWHWGPDEALDLIPAGYTDGKAYASASILASFNDIEGWLSGLDNGRPGCGALNNCPRTWVSPFFNSAREKSREIMDELGTVVSMGEQRFSPFPARSLSYKTAGKRFSTITLPVSDWFVGLSVAQSTELHTVSSIRAGIDFYHQLGALINFYSHLPSNNGSIQQEYVTYSVTKPGLWKTNAVELNDWWRLRSSVAIVPVMTTTADSYVATVALSGATAADTAIEMVIPKTYTTTPTVFLNGLVASSSDYRITTNGVKIKVGSTVTSVRVQSAVNQAPVATSDSYSTSQNSALTVAAPGLLANDTDPEGSPLAAVKVSDPAHGTLVLNSDGSFTYTPMVGYNGNDSFSYQASDGALSSSTATVTLTIVPAPAGSVLFSDDFSRTLVSPWISQSGSWAITGDVLQGSGTSMAYSYAFIEPALQWSDYSVEASIQLPAGAFGGGLGGRLNPSTGAHYGAWIYPTGSLGGSNVLKLVKFSSWTSWNGTPLKQVSLPAVGTGWHTLKMVFSGSRIQVYYDGTLLIDVTDTSYTSGGISADLWTYTTSYQMGFDNVVVKSLADNQAPVATSDSYSTGQDIALAVVAPGVLANDIDPEGAPLNAVKVSNPSHGTLVLNSNGSFTYTPVTGYSGSDSFSYQASDGLLSSTTVTVTITVIPADTTLYSDDFARTLLSPWIRQSGSWAITSNILQGSGTKSAYSYAYFVPAQQWSDYSVEASIQLPAGAFGGGLGGRLNPSTGAHYGAWIYPTGSLGGSNVLKLVKFSGWTSWSGTPMKQVSLPAVGTGWHTIKMVFSGSRIQVYYDGTLLIDVTDTSYTSGGISADMWTYTTSYQMGFDNVVVSLE